MCWILNMSNILNILCEYAGCNCGRVLNIPGLQVCQVSAYASIALGSEYAWSTFHRVLVSLWF